MSTPDRTILIIDDDDSIRSLLSVHLRQEGYRSETAESGREGLAKARDLHPGLILLDVALPDISGLETLQQLKGDPALADIPVVILSGYPLNQGTNVFLEAGAAAFLTKSFKLKEVIAQCLSFMSGNDDE